MIEVRIPKDFRTYKEKLFFGFDLRQTVCTAIALLICVPLYVVGQKYISSDLLSWIIIILAAPLVLIGFFNFNQMTFEKFIIAWFKLQWYPQKRPFKLDSSFSTIRDMIIRDEINMQKAAHDKSSSIKKASTGKPVSKT